uniref:Cryptide Pep-16 n=1 Tax=Tityus obscurus TaxID=1221240 RepID=CRY16_TITOB
PHWLFFGVSVLC